MRTFADETIPLEALSRPQRLRVEKNLPLIHLVLRRYLIRLGEARVGRERGELFQEGAVALAEAVRMHDPRRHGRFAAYAMSRIRFAISKFVHEQCISIRVPFITQRRGKPRPHVASAFRDASDFSVAPDLSRPAHRTTAESPLAFEGDATTGPNREAIGEMIRDRIDEAGRAVRDGMNRDRRKRRELAGLINECHAERWSIPEMDAQTPIRRICTKYGCSSGRVTHAEKRWRQLTAEHLKADPEFSRLCRLAGIRDPHSPTDGKRSKSPAQYRPDRQAKLDPRSRGDFPDE